MKILGILIALCATAVANTNTTYVVPASMGAVIENNSTPCGVDARTWLEQFVKGLQVIVIGKRAHIAIVYSDTTRLPDYEVPGDPLMGFWRQKQKTIYVALEGDDVHPRVTVAFIFHDDDSTCYEKWEGLAVQR
jgi:hypothetical protein